MLSKFEICFLLRENTYLRADSPLVFCCLTRLPIAVTLACQNLPGLWKLLEEKGITLERWEKKCCSGAGTTESSIGYKQGVSDSEGVIILKFMLPSLSVSHLRSLL